MIISVRQLATAVNNCGRITPESHQAAPGMSTWEIAILNEHCHIVDRSYHTGWFQEEAENIAQRRCAELHEYTWQVIKVA